MSLIKRNQNDKSVQTLRSGFDSLFDSLFDNVFNDSVLRNSFNTNLIETSFKPKVNIAENKDSYQIDAELPGVKKADIELEYTDGILTIKAERKEKSEDKDKNYHKIESFYGTFLRSIQMPNVNYDNVKAKFTDGILKIELPKSKEDKNCNKIAIE